MSQPTRCFLLLVGVLLFLPWTLTAAEPSSPPTRETVAKWIKQLGDGDFQTRENASRQLWQAGRVAETALREALKSDDPEVVRRSQELLDKFKWGIYPDTPKKMVALIERYQAADANGKQAVVRELLDLGGPGCAVILKFAAAEDNQATRDELFQQVALELPRALPGILAEGNWSLLEELLDLSLLHDPETTVRNYAAYYLLRGKLDERIAYFTARLGKDEKPPAAEVLVYLYRAKGDLKAALTAAEKSGKKELIDAVLYEQHNWKKLVERGAGAPGEEVSDVEGLGFKAAYQRLAGDQEAFEKTVTAIRERAIGKPREEAGDIWLCAKMLFLNDRPQDALKLLDAGHNPQNAFDILCAQLRFREAFEVVDKARADAAPELRALEVQQARILHQLGDKDSALQLFARLGQDIKEGNEGPWAEALVEAEARLGLQEQALSHCAQILALAKDEGTAPRVLEKLFPRKGETAEVWWKFLRAKYPQDAGAAVMKRVQAVLTGKATDKELESWLHDAEDAGKDSKEEDRERWLLALADAALAGKNDRLAQSYLEKAAALNASPQAALQLGDFLAERKQWAAAAVRYADAWKKDQREPLPLFLQGWALSQAGQEKEGKKLMDLAHWLPLADDYARHNFATVLAERGQREAARRERELLLRIEGPGSAYAGDVLRYRAFEALTRKDYAATADYHELATLRVLRVFVSFAQTQAYVIVPENIHRYRARALLGAGRFEDARKEIELCLTALPGDAEMPILVAAEMEKQGHKKEMDEWFARVYTLYEKLCKEYPQSAWCHNSLAWLAAGCHRNLEQALEHAKKAVELAPDNAGYLDTLAETHFQRGEKDRAIELMRKCLALEPKNGYFARQLKRFEAGDRNAEVPDPDVDD